MCLTPFVETGKETGRKRQGIDKGKKKIKRRSCKCDARIGAEEKGGTESGR